MKDYYAILGVDEKASTQEISKQYHRLAKMFHPDLHNGSQWHSDQLAQYNEAWELLKSNQKRKEYDMERKNRNIATSSVDNESRAIQFQKTESEQNRDGWTFMLSWLGGCLFWSVILIGLTMLMIWLGLKWMESRGDVLILMFCRINSLP